MSPESLNKKQLSDTLCKLDVSIYCKNVLVKDIVNQNSHKRSRLRLLSDSYNQLTGRNLHFYFDDIFEPCRFYSGYFSPLFCKNFRQLNLDIHESTMIVVLDFSLSLPTFSFFAGSQTQEILSSLISSLFYQEDDEHCSELPAWSFYLDLILEKYYTSNTLYYNDKTRFSEVLNIQACDSIANTFSLDSKNESIKLPPLVGNLGTSLASNILLDISPNTVLLTPFFFSIAKKFVFRYQLLISTCLLVGIPILFDPLLYGSSSECPYLLRKYFARLHAQLQSNNRRPEAYASFALAYQSLANNNRSCFSDFSKDSLYIWFILLKTYQYYTASYDPSVSLFSNEDSYFYSSECSGDPVILVGRKNFTGGYGKILDMYVAMLQHLKRPFLNIDINGSKPFGPSLGNISYSVDDSGVLRCDNDTKVIIIDTPSNADSFIVDCKPSNLFISTIAESESIPAEWHQYLSKYSRILIPTEFNYRTFYDAGISADALGIVPYFVDSSFFSRTSQPDYSTLKMLCIASSNNRKDIASLIRILNELKKRDIEFKLVLKFMHNTDALLAALKSRHGITDEDISQLIADGNLQIIGGNVSDDFIRDLHRSSNIYITTERSKGWDLPAHEAMSCGNPVVSIWGSASSFLNLTNSFLVHGNRNLCTADNHLHTNPSLYSNNYWQDISIDSFVNILAMLSKRTDLIKIKGLNAILDARCYNVMRSSASLSAFL